MLYKLGLSQKSNQISDQQLLFLRNCYIYSDVPNKTKLTMYVVYTTFSKRKFCVRTHKLCTYDISNRVYTLEFLIFFSELRNKQSVHHRQEQYFFLHVFPFFRALIFSFLINLHQIKKRGWLVSFLVSARYLSGITAHAFMTSGRIVSGA